MKIYFLSSTPCALTINGAYFGVSDLFDRHAELSLKDNVFVQFTPENALPIGFFLTENIRFSPPDGCDVYLLSGAIAIYAHDFPKKCAPLTVITQARFEKSLLTVFQQGSVQLSLETEKNFFVATLPPSFEKCELEKRSDFYFLRSPTQLAIYTQNGECIFLENVLEYETKETELSAILPLSDSKRRQANCKWELTEDGAKLTQFTLQQADSENANAELLPYAFFESILIGADYAQMLSDELQPSAEKMKEYLGEYESVVFTENPNRLGLVKKKAERLFEVSYYTVSVENGKITDVSP